MSSKQSSPPGYDIERARDVLTAEKLRCTICERTGSLNPAIVGQDEADKFWEHYGFHVGYRYPIKWYDSFEIVER